MKEGKIYAATKAAKDNLAAYKEKKKKCKKGGCPTCPPATPAQTPGK